PMVVCRAPWLPADLGSAERSVSFAGEAAGEALAGAPGASRLGPVPVFVGLPEARPGRPAGLGAAVRAGPSAALAPRAQVSEVVAIASGHASGLQALAEAHARIVRGEADLCLAGGVESYIEAETLEWIEDSGQLHAATNTWGFTPGEAAGF